jgi:hypothetical protein
LTVLGDPTTTEVGEQETIVVEVAAFTAKLDVPKLLGLILLPA